VAQVKVYGRQGELATMRAALSELIHASLVAAFGLPPSKKFQRFFGLEPEDFVHPPDRSNRYTIIEIQLFEGRSNESKRQLIRELYRRAQQDLDLAPTDLEITLLESPRVNWGIRGKPGDELELDYKVEV